MNHADDDGSSSSCSRNDIANNDVFCSWLILNYHQLWEKTRLHRNFECMLQHPVLQASLYEIGKKLGSQFVPRISFRNSNSSIGSIIKYKSRGGLGG